MGLKNEFNKKRHFLKVSFFYIIVKNHNNQKVYMLLQMMTNMETLN